MFVNVIQGRTSCTSYYLFMRKESRTSVFRELSVIQNFYEITSLTSALKDNNNNNNIQFFIAPYGYSAVASESLEGVGGTDLRFFSLTQPYL